MKTCLITWCQQIDVRELPDGIGLVFPFLGLAAGETTVIGFLPRGEAEKAMRRLVSALSTIQIAGKSVLSLGRLYCIQLESKCFMNGHAVVLGITTDARRVEVVLKERPLAVYSKAQLRYFRVKPGRWYLQGAQEPLRPL
jgi:hypothetical protein